MSTRPVRIGCSGWQYRDWRGVLYPEGLGQARWLARYAEVFDTVEVNSTFYRLASEKAVARWVEQVPPDFCFALKASRYLIHMKKLRDIEDGIGRFYERIRPLTGTPKMGPVLWQLPEWFRRDDDVLGHALALLPDGRHCFEFRDPRADEVAHHLPWLAAQLDAIRPRLLVPLGRHALLRFAPDATITQAHGRVMERDGRTLFPMYHPAAALRNPKLRETLHEDARALRDLL